MTQGNQHALALALEVDLVEIGRRCALSLRLRNDNDAMSRADAVPSCAPSDSTRTAISSALSPAAPLSSRVLVMLASPG
jgi:hypothetical protein